MFQKRIMPSAVPPPEASSVFCHGHHAMALTAACGARCRGAIVSASASATTGEGFDVHYRVAVASSWGGRRWIRRPGRGHTLWASRR